MPWVAAGGHSTVYLAGIALWVNLARPGMRRAHQHRWPSGVIRGNDAAAWLRRRRALQVPVVPRHPGPPTAQTIAANRSTAVDRLFAGAEVNPTSAAHAEPGVAITVYSSSGDIVGTGTLGGEHPAVLDGAPMGDSFQPSAGRSRGLKVPHRRGRPARKVTVSLIARGRSVCVWSMHGCQAWFRVPLDVCLGGWGKWRKIWARTRHMAQIEVDSNGLPSRAALSSDGA